jgi:hypothetical protein
MYFISTRSLFSRSSKLALLFTIFSIQGEAQVSQPLRFEFPLLRDEKQFEIASADHRGLFLHRTVLAQKESHLQIIRLDTALTELWQGFIQLDRNYLVAAEKAHGRYLYVLTKYRDFSRNNFILYRIDESTGGYLEYDIRGYIPFTPSEFSVTDKAVLIGGYYNRVPLVVHFSLTTLQSKVLPGLFNEAGELTQIKVYDDASFDVLISAMNFQRQRTITIKNYDPEGDLIRQLPIETDPNKHLIFGRSLKTVNDMQIVAGVYGTRAMEFSRGIFVASIDPSGLQHIRYYNFGDLENFFKYMKAKREQRVKSRIERRRIKGKKIKFNYRFLVHELIPYKDQYVLLGEAFYPKYINVDRGYYGGFFTMRIPNGPVRDGRIFDGYHYTHAVVMGFKPDGDLLWDNSFEINDLRTFQLEQFVKLDADDDKIALVYLFDNKIRTKIIRDNDVIEGKTVDPIKIGEYDGIVRKDSDNTNKLDYWYNDFMFATGIQTIETFKGDTKRRVFYINKIKPE